MSTAKPPRTAERTKRNPRDPGPERERSWRPTDDDPESDGTVDSEMEFDTEKYERSPKG